MPKAIRTHADLSREFRDLGQKTRKALPKNYRPLAAPHGHRDDVFLRVHARGGTQRSVFGRLYRGSMPKHDEILSTASVREIVSGVRKAPLSPDEVQAVNSAINDVSRVRIPTGYVGYAFAGGESMQHPTSAPVFADPRTTAGAHSRHDLLRRVAALVEAQQEAAKPGANIVTMARAALRGALLYTLNEMTVAATASDVAPFTRTRSPTVQLAQMNERERLKHVLRIVGGSVARPDPNETARGRETRPSRTTRGTRESSPFR